MRTSKSRRRRAEDSGEGDGFELVEDEEARAEARAEERRRKRARRRKREKRAEAAEAEDSEEALPDEVPDEGPWAGALPIDFGLAATYRLAFETYKGILGRAFLWNLVAAAATFTLAAIPIVLGVMVFLSNPEAWQGVLGLGLAIGGAVVGWVLWQLVLLPAGCAVLVDQSIRKRGLPLKEALAEAGLRTMRMSGHLFQIFAVYALLTLLLLLPGLTIFYVVGTSGAVPLAVALLSIWMAGGLLLIATGLSLGIPACILEERSALTALQRGWELAQRHFWEYCVAILMFCMLYAIATSIVSFLAELVSWSFGIPAVGGLIGLVLATVVDLFWPALLTCAYHGLVAEADGVLGRDS